MIRYYSLTFTCGSQDERTKIISARPVLKHLPQLEYNSSNAPKAPATSSRLPTSNAASNSSQTRSKQLMDNKSSHPPANNAQNDRQSEEEHRERLKDNNRRYVWSIKEDVHIPSSHMLAGGLWKSIVHLHSTSQTSMPVYSYMLHLLMC